ncbi:MAG: saccharopine dehydrogenase (NAD+, L-lysine-forming) [Parasphingorhabdus sp.]|jgi:saccharopine dehydrogenase (NAD+, L-lysine-forming)
MTHLWLRAETKANEHRTPLTPAHARQLLELGFQITVEKSTQRIFADSFFTDAGCKLAPAGSWPNADAECFILGIKELPDDETMLGHKHIMFGHLYKDQDDWHQQLSRFRDGGGMLLDLEYLTDNNGRRVSAFGYWAGFAGAALAIKQWLGRQAKGDQFQLSAERPYSNQSSLIQSLTARSQGLNNPRVLVIGSLGRCGRGAMDLCRQLGIEPDGWDQTETSTGGPFASILQYDILVNSVLLGEDVAPFINRDLLDSESRKLQVIGDVSCDPNNPGNPLPIYNRITDFEQPVLRVNDTDPALDIIAVDHLPSLLPKESSEDFSAQLVSHLIDLDKGSEVWNRCIAIYQHHCRRL